MVSTEPAAGQRDSYVFYALADTYSAELLIKRVSVGDITYRGLIDEKIFAHVLNGLLKSNFTTPAVLAYYHKNKKP